MASDRPDLGRRAVACAGWRWLEGMRWVGRDALTGEPCEGRIGVTAETVDDLLNPSVVVGVLPDLQDPATKGCVLALVREAVKDPTACCFRWARPTPSRLLWEVSSCVGVPCTLYGTGYTEAEALIETLEDANAAL